MPLNLRAGELDDRIIIQHDSDATLDPDFGSEVNNWVTFATVWSDFNPVGGVEFFSAQQRVTKRQGTFIIHHNAAVTSLMRVSFDGDLWNIHRIDLVGRKESMMLFCTARED